MKHFILIAVFITSTMYLGGTVLACQGCDCPPGPQGDKGDKGDRGERGYTGKRGRTGLIGLSGLRGTHGINGVNGVNGSVGAKGDTGFRGPQGNTGATGATGATGKAGRDSDDAYGAVAGAMAMGMLEDPYVGGMVVTGGTSYYHDSGAIAIGFGKSFNDSWSAKASALLPLRMMAKM